MNQRQKHTIRELAAEDFERLGVITYQAYQTIDGLPPQTDHPFNVELCDVAGRAATPGNLILGVYNSETDELLGGVTLTFEFYSKQPPYPLIDEAGIRMLAISPQAVGSGMGRALMHECITRAKQAGKQRIILHSISAMKAARSLYQSIGFYRVSELDVKRGNIEILCYKIDLEK